jgi:hypothetical protein
MSEPPLFCQNRVQFWQMTSKPTQQHQLFSVVKNIQQTKPQLNEFRQDSQSLVSYCRDFLKSYQFCVVNTIFSLREFII